ncbi:transposase [Acidiphilium multivorum]|nr:transposase [Acidiphilium multivorum]
MGCGGVSRHRARLCLENFATPEGVPVVDVTGFLKMGKTSRGVARQYAGSAGKIANGRVGMLAAYVSAHAMPLSIGLSICRSVGAAILQGLP